MNSDELAIRDLYVENQKALDAGDVASLATFYLPHSIQIPPDSAELEGWEEIERSLKKGLDKTQIKTSINVNETMVDGCLAFARGTYVTTIFDSEEEVIKKAQGAWLDVLIKQSGHDWKILRSSWSKY
jgi:ketosteroid isomerase-like protein